MDARTPVASSPSEPSPHRLAPLAGAERIESIDVLRGLAVLGILVMNIPTFAFSEYAFFNPTVQGGFEGADRWAWIFSHVFFDLKMMSIFSMLFGAGLIVMDTRASARGVRLAGVYYRRLTWLLLFGLLHAYIIWEGDILFTYAICGMALFPFRRLRPRWLIALGAILLLIPLPINSLFGLFFDLMRSAANDAARGVELESWRRGLASSWEETSRGFVPTPEMLQTEREQFLGGYFDGLARRAPAALFMQTFLLVTWSFWRCAGLMLVGMALMKLGVFSAQCSSRTYLRLLVAGYALGFPLVAAGAGRLIAHNFDFVEMFKLDFHFNYIGSIGVALGHSAVVMLICRHGVLTPLRRALAAVGRMAFSNYIAQSLICALLFYGWGFALWGKVSRAELLPIVVVIWMAQIAFSLAWLARFRFGPLEWIWRTLTYLRAPRLLRQAPAQLSPPPPA